MAHLSTGSIGGNKITATKQNFTFNNREQIIKQPVAVAVLSIGR